MGEVTIRWQDMDNSLPGIQSIQIARERTLVGENVGYDMGEKDPAQVFLRVWADDKTFLVYQNRVILVDVKK